MRKRPSAAYQIEFWPTSRTGRFPVQLLRQPDHSDAPIRRLHVHECLEVGLCHAGSGLFVVGGKVLPFRAGDVSIITEHEPHFARSSPGTRSDWTWLWFDPVTLLAGGPPVTARFLSSQPISGAGFRNLFALADPGSPKVMVEELIGELSRREAGWEMAARGLIVALLCRVHRRAMPANSVATPGGFQRIGPALDYLASHSAGEVDPVAVAALCGMSLTHFRRRFRSVMGRSPHQYLLELRVGAAAAALQDGRRRITEVAFDSGFGTLSGFDRAFQKVLGMSPRAWRAGSGVGRPECGTAGNGGEPKERRLQSPKAGSR